MNFDFGEILTRAWRITWKHKVLWAISILPFLTMFLFLPFWLIFVFQENVDFDTMSTWMQNPVYMSVAVVVYLVIFAASIFLQIASRSSLTLGIYRAEYELIKSHIWKYVLITIIIYFGMNILISLVTFPLMIPMFFFMTRTMEAGLDFNNLIRMQAIFGVVILPLMALVQGFSLTYMKSAMMLTYLRLTQPSQSQPLPAIVEAIA